MKRKYLILALLNLVVPFCAYAQWQEGASNPISENEWRISSGEFGAMLLITGNYEQFIREWQIPDSPAHKPVMFVANTSTRGATVYAVVLFSNCKPSPKGNCDSEVDYKVTKPDGTLYSELKANELWSGLAPLANVLTLGHADLGIRFESNDPFGVYTIEATVRDKQANRKLVLSRQIRLDDVDLSSASSKSAFPPTTPQWTFIDTDGQGNLWSVDAASVVPYGSMVKALERIDFKQPQPYPLNGELIRYIYSLNIVNCADHQIGVKASRLLRTDGSIIAEHEDNDSAIKWQTMASNTVSEKTMTYVCSFATKLGK